MDRVNTSQKSYFDSGGTCQDNNFCRGAVVAPIVGALLVPMHDGVNKSFCGAVHKGHLGPSAPQRALVPCGAGKCKLHTD